MNEINIYRCDSCGEPCVLIVSGDSRPPKTCPYSFGNVTTAVFVEVK